MKKYLTLGNILVCCAALLGLISIFLMFAPAISYTLDVGIAKGTQTYTGAQIAFGYTEKSEVLGQTIEAQIFKFSFMNFLPYVLALAGVVLAVLSVFFKCKYIAPVAAGCFLVAGVFFFCAVPFTVPAGENATMEGFTLAAGAIVSGIFSILSAALSAAPIFIKKK